jgi:F-type H+-transporting ATPase subunit delta
VLIFFRRQRKSLTVVLEAIRANLQEALKVAAGNGTEEDKVEARIEAEVYEALQHAVGSK